MSECPELDFAAARALNKEGVARFVHERSVIAALNDRLAGLIEVVRHENVHTHTHPRLCWVTTSCAHAESNDVPVCGPIIIFP